jgi:glycosyltransferase involved in cell wall biosynthesis
VPYINAAPFRAATRAGAFGVQLATLIARRQGRPEFVLTYNVDAASAVPAMILQAAGVPWIAVIADMPDDFLRRRSHDILNARPAGHVFLSWETYLEWPGEPKLHLDGGIDGVDHESGTAVVERAVLYSGVLGEYGGVDTLLDAFLRLSDSKAQLWVCGKGRNARLEAASRHDPRIKLWGAVDDSTLQSLSRRALAFVNPRPTSMPASRNNFPSKLLEYLRWGKPVISTWTEGLAPAYRDVLLVVDDNVEAFTRALQTVLQMPAALQDETAARIRTYAAEHSWDAQSVRLIKWLRECTWRI